MQERTTKRPVPTGGTFNAFGVEIYVAGVDMYGVTLRVRKTERRPSGRLIDVTAVLPVQLDRVGTVPESPELLQGTAPPSR